MKIPRYCWVVEKPVEPSEIQRESWIIIGIPTEGEKHQEVIYINFCPLCYGRCYVCGENWVKIERQWLKLLCNPQTEGNMPNYFVAIL